jgi:hypothetical protein
MRNPRRALDSTYERLLHVAVDVGRRRQKLSVAGDTDQMSAHAPQVGEGPRVSQDGMIYNDIHHMDARFARSISCETR